jgi:outer membrane protein assembly factor BamB
MRRPIKMPACKRLLCCLAALLLFFPSAYAIDKAHYSELLQKLGTLAKQKDWQGARNVLTEIGRELPAPTPRYLLIVASVEAHLGHKAEALQWLQKYAATGLSYDIAKDDDLKALLAEDAGKKVAAEMKQRSQPVEKAEFVCTLPQADTMPEDITYLKSSDAKSAPSFIVSSIQHHTLYRVSQPKAANKSGEKAGDKINSKECTMTELPLPEEAKRWPTLAVSAAPGGKVLWMTANAMPGFTGFPKEDEGKAALFAIDAQSGKVLHRFDPGITGPAVLGDMSVTEDGTVYVTDSMGGGVYRLRGNSQREKDEAAKLEKIADGLFSPQTPVLSRDGKRLFVTDYTIGVAVIDLASAGPMAKASYLPHPENVAVVGLDGLYLSGDSLIGIQNGTEPNRILRMKLNSAQTEITGAEVIEQATERMGDPTHAVVADGWFYVSANVGWSKVEDNGKLKEGEKFTPPVLLRFPAPGRAGK